MTPERRGNQSLILQQWSEAFEYFEVACFMAGNVYELARINRKKMDCTRRMIKDSLQIK